MEKKIDVIIESIKELQEITRAIYDRQEETDAKIENITLDIHKMHGDIVALKEGQKRQEKILETLALRSIEQESELREVKRAK